MKLLRLKGRKTSEQLLRKGMAWKGKHLTIRWLPGIPRIETKEGLYLGTFASGKLNDSAVTRNRMRRRCREALRLAVQTEEHLPSAQLLVSPRSSSLHVPFRDLQQEVRTFLSVLRACQPTPRRNSPSAGSS